jgi:molybdopterin synthase sulfur carrier subunit
VPRIAFTSALERHVLCPPERVDGATLRTALEAYFALHPPVRGYVLDDQGTLRQHVVVFVDGIQARGLGDAVSREGEIWVMQALSGG